jgi:phage terminase large subunit GpA-like protein
MVINLVDDIDLSLVSGFLVGLKPAPTTTVSEWADANRKLPPTSAEPGPWKTSRTPYLREIMDKLSVNDPAQKITVIKGSQLGLTEAGNNWMGYIMDVAPAPTIYIMPTDGLMKRTSKQRIEKMIESTPKLQTKVPKARGKEGGNTLLYKDFPDGFITMIGANSPVGLSSTAAKNIYGDEIDRYPTNVGDEGSAIKLAEARTSTFGTRKKIFLTSSPTLKKTSQIDKIFQKTGQRYYHVPCPLCNEYQVLNFTQLKWETGKYDNVQYECIQCNGLFSDDYFTKTKMLEQGKWVPKFPEKEDGYSFGYQISALYSPPGMYSWKQMAEEYDEAVDYLPDLVVFTNTKLGECYEEKEGYKVEWETLHNRAEEGIEGKPFASVAFLTAGVDVQKDRLELEVVGWMKGRTSQSIEYLTIIGDTSGAEPWTELSKILNRTWERQGDKALLPIRLMAVDTGYNTEKVYEFTSKYSTQRVIPIKGDERLKMFFSPPKTVDIVKAGKAIGKVKVWRLGVGMLKSELYGFLKLSIDLETGIVPDGYCHFPKRDFKYFKGITAEELQQVTNKRDYESYAWRKNYKRNEPLDCRVYARAAAAVIGMDRWDDARWERESSNYTVKQVETPAKAQKRKSDFWGGSSDLWKQ